MDQIGVGWEQFESNNFLTNFAGDDASVATLTVLGNTLIVFRLKLHVLGSSDAKLDCVVRRRLAGKDHPVGGSPEGNIVQNGSSRQLRE